MRAFQRLIRREEADTGQRRIDLRRECNLMLRAGGGPRFDAKDVDAIRAYYRRYGLVCVRDGLTPKTHQMILRATRNVTPTHDVRQNSRLTTCLPRRISRHVYADPLLRRLFGQLHDFPLQESSFPMEFRTYPSDSSGMAWHKDLRLTQPKQTEMVYTVHNDNSASRLVWKIEGGSQVSVRPQRGDLVFVLPDRADHQVTSMRGGGGTRSILKFIAHPHSARKLKQFDVEKKQALSTAKKK